MGILLVFMVADGGEVGEVVGLSVFGAAFLGLFNVVGSETKFMVGVVAVIARQSRYTIDLRLNGVMVSARRRHCAFWLLFAVLTM